MKMMGEEVCDESSDYVLAIVNNETGEVDYRPGDSNRVLSLYTEYCQFQHSIQQIFQLNWCISLRSLLHNLRWTF